MFGHLAVPRPKPKMKIGHNFRPILKIPETIFMSIVRFISKNTKLFTFYKQNAMVLNPLNQHF